jgi:hypothetical protein
MDVWHRCRFNVEDVEATEIQMFEIVILAPLGSAE